MAQPPRFAARSRILTDLSVSEGARLLYLFLDDQSRGERTVKVKCLRLAVQMGISTRQLTRYLRSLERAEYLKTVRTIRGNMYDLLRTPMSDSNQTPMSARIGPLSPIPIVERAREEQETSSRPPTPYGKNPETPGPICPECGGRGVKPEVSRGLAIARRCGKCGGRGTVAA